MGIGNPVHLAFIAIVALIVLGPKRLPEVARSLGHGYREFMAALNSAANGESEEEQPDALQPAAVHPTVVTPLQPNGAEAVATPPQPVDVPAVATPVATETPPPAPEESSAA